MRLILIRHGESQHSQRGRIAGYASCPGLTARGFQQAQVLADRLRVPAILPTVSRCYRARYCAPGRPPRCWRASWALARSSWIVTCVSCIRARQMALPGKHIARYTAASIWSPSRIARLRPALRAGRNSWAACKQRLIAWRRALTGGR